ncbi:MAG TPA: formylglycine-generating enzyme family protein [Anaerolineales bacterium]|jgi:formylglycine-generating enzyme required for sulfatase activity
MSELSPGPGRGQELSEFSFETPSVNERGEIIARQQGSVRFFTEALGGGVTLEMVLLPGGMFPMGSRAGLGYDDERPQHMVRVGSFLLGKFTVTQEQWLAVMDKALPYRSKGDKKPADRISWELAEDFCRRLSKNSGRAYRLPAEAEWEYACRAGTSGPFSFGETLTTDLVNYVGEHTYRSEPKGVYRHGSIEVGSLPPNAFGLYEMHGNVWEWCADAWHENYDGAPADGSAWDDLPRAQRTLRGGCWHDTPELCRSAARLKSLPEEGEDFFGFRVALSSL